MTVTPTAKQIDYAELFGWFYEGLGLFSRGEQMGHFTVNGWEYL